MKPQVKTALLIALVSLNIATLGLAAGSSIYMLRRTKAAAAENSTAAESSTAEEESSDIFDIDDPSEESEDTEIDDADSDFEAGENRENNVRIGGAYVIRSTKQISDAYISGDSSALSDADKETLQLASDLTKEIITAGMSDYEKEKAVYDWMCANLTFDDGMMTVISTAGREVDQPHGVLQTHKAVCVGFATTFRLLMQMQGIECKVVHDSYRGHSWDCAKIGDHWYYTDIYSDIGTGDYSHFNLTNGLFSADHEWDQEFFPVADSLEYNPAYIDRVKVDDVYGTAQALRDAMDENKGALCVEYGAKTLTDDEKAVVNCTLQAIQEHFTWGEDYSGLSQPNQFSVFTDPDTGKDMLFVNFYNDREEPELPTDISDEAADKADDALQEAFGDIAYLWVNR